MEPAKKRPRGESSKEDPEAEDEESEELQLAVDEDGRVGVSGTVPNYAFRSFPNYLAIGDDKAALAMLHEECQIAFTAREAQKGEAYSQGETFWVPATATSPATLLERLALDIFRLHAGSAEYDPLKSGAEWWTQVIELDADIGWHWDRDYGLEADTGFSLHPHVATVTYLTESGAPTVIVEAVHRQAQGGATMTSSRYPKLAHLSQPRLGKHISFDGRWLHAAPSDLAHLAPVAASSRRSVGRTRCFLKSRRRLLLLRRFGKLSKPISYNPRQEGDLGQSGSASRRVTFLVNVWLNHRPLNVTTFPGPAGALSRASGENNRLLPAATPTEAKPTSIRCNSAADAEVFKWRFSTGGEDDAEEGEEEESDEAEDEKEEADDRSDRQWCIRLALPTQGLRNAMLARSPNRKWQPDSFTVELAPGLAELVPPGNAETK